MTVFGASGEPQTPIEVIVAHEPDQPVYDYAQANGIALADYRRCEHCSGGTCNCTGLPTPLTGAAVDSLAPEGLRANVMTRIRCGHCKDRHATIEEVRACSAGSWSLT